ncbi:MAG: hypothetical protein ACLF0G_14825 [Candidatus Brocadiia bacterium]
MRPAKLSPGAPLLAIALGAWLPAVGGERRIAVEPSATRVPRYERVDFALQVTPVRGDPYDPGEVDFRLELTAPDGEKLLLPAFLYQPFERREVARGGRKAEWLYPVGEPVWKARFAPTAAGTYSVVARLDDLAGQVASEPLRFECVPSESQGYVRVSARNPRYLALDDGTSFFAVGQNAAFVTDSAATAEKIRKLGASGANYVRIWACCEDWAMAIEARKSAWGRSWAWKPPIAHLPGREGYHSDATCVRITGQEGAAVSPSPTRPVALRPETRYRLAGKARTDEGVGLRVQLSQPRLTEELPPSRGWRDFACEFTTAAGQMWLGRLRFELSAAGSAWLRDLSLQEAGGGPELLWEADTNRPLRGAINQQDAFMVDHLVATAEDCGVRLQLVLLTRDHYMGLLRHEGTRDYARAVAAAKRLVRYAAARWSYSTAVATWEFFNEMNPGLPTNRFYAEAGTELRRLDPARHLRATSAWAMPAPKDYRHPQLDVADTHYYLRPVTGELFHDAAASVLHHAGAFLDRVPPKPGLFSEFGITTDKWRRAPELDKDTGFVHLHNALWASALSGLASTVMHWYWDDIHKRDLYGHYRPVAAFVADIPFADGPLEPARAAAKPELRVVGLQRPQAAYLWLQDPRATWWAVAVEEREPGEIRNARLTIEGLRPGAYRVEWWDTRAGAVASQARARVAGEPLALDVPAFRRDIACKVLPAAP